jgi:multimeric flavodoxin WrbA
MFNPSQKKFLFMEVPIMKVLGIVGSPRKGGNTEILVREALTAVKEAGAETEIVLAADKNIAGCDGCSSCRQTGVCRIKDDMQPLYKQLEAADAVIFGTPVYFHNVTAQAKAIMDRMFLFLPDRRLKGKVVAPIVALRRVGAAQTQNLLYGFFIAQGMIPVRAAIGYGREKGDVKQGVGGSIDLSALEEARNVGLEVIQILQKLSKS